MLLLRIRRPGARVCLGVLPLIVYATVAQARMVPSALSGRVPLAEARASLVRELAVQRLTGLGLDLDEATAMVDSVFAADIPQLVRNEMDAAESGAGAVPEDAWHAAGERYAHALTERGVLTIDEDHVAVLASGGKVVGFNWKGLLLVVLPVVVVGAVLVASGSGGAALLAVGAVVGLALVLFVEPQWVFGAG